MTSKNSTLVDAPVADKFGNMTNIMGNQKTLLDSSGSATAAACQAVSAVVNLGKIFTVNIEPYNLIPQIHACLTFYADNMNV